FAELVKRYNHSKALQLVEVCHEQSMIFHKELIKTISLSDAFGSLYFKEDPADEDFCMCGCGGQGFPEKEDDDESISYRYPSKPRVDSYDDLAPNVDEKNEYLPINTDYLLGDVLFLQTPALCHLEYNGRNEEVHLGNQGFSGMIYSDYAIIASI